MSDVLQKSGRSLAHRVYALRRYVGTAINCMRVTGKPQCQVVILQTVSCETGVIARTPRTDLVRAYLFAISR